VAAHDWATWHLNNQPKSAKCRMLTCPCACHLLSPTPVTPCQPDVSSATSACATCHPYSGDTCHPLIGPTVLSCMLTSPATCHLQELPHHLYGHTACTVSLPRGTVRTVQSSHFFACLGFWTERDIFRIQSPFDEVNIWPESGRRDRRNGVGFVRFRALSFLSLF
jgi:hypothetical protein